MVLKGLITPAGGAPPDLGGADTALQRVANRPLVCHALEALRQANVAGVALLVPSSQSARLRACVTAEGPAGLDVEYVPYESGAFERALASAGRFVGESPCVVHAANGLLTQPLAPLVGALDARDRDLVACVHRRRAGTSVGLAARRMLRLTGVHGEDRALDLAGVCLLGPGALHGAIGAGTWRGEELDVVAMAEALVDAGGRVGIEQVSGWRSNGGEASDLLECNRIALDALCREPHEEAATANGEAEASGNRIEGYVEAHPTACVRSSVIVGPATLGPGAQVVDSYIGPYTSIGADVRIESAEVERSIILRGASVTHIGGRLVGSVVGRDARVFRDFSLPRALRLNVGDGGEVALC
jgi:glucose-1-phosphate thymidylyltransferase